MHVFIGNRKSAAEGVSKTSTNFICWAGSYPNPNFNP